MQIPGISDLVDKGTLPESLILITGPSGSGKTVYCRQFLADGISDGSYCIYISSSLTSRQFKTQFSNIKNLDQNSKFLNPYLYTVSSDNAQQKSSHSRPASSINSTDNNWIGAHNEHLTADYNDSSKVINKLTMIIAEIYHLIMRVRKSANGNNDNNNIYNGGAKEDQRPFSYSLSHDFSSQGGRPIRLIVDSLTQLAAIFGENAVLSFVNELSFVLKNAQAAAVFTLTTPTNEQFANALTSILDGIIEMKFEEYNGALLRSIRLLSIKCIYHTPSWINFKISDDGSLIFADQSSSLTCMLCGKPIFGTPILDSEFTFDSETCLEMYKKLSGVYGSNISDIGLPSEVVNVNFFYVDIVSLSDPSLSVKKQREKIAILNKMIASCEAYYGSKDKKIILPTGDGMAIGFLLNPELPFQLSIQLHARLKVYNRGKSHEDTIGVRIGLGSGPVFIVNDIKDNQNVWGPGIILARRVMDIGDNFHILLAGRLAEELIALKDEYKIAIRPITIVKIKHGQTIKLYSAFSNDFGNPRTPSKIVEHSY